MDSFVRLPKLWKISNGNSVSWLSLIDTQKMKSEMPLEINENPYKTLIESRSCGKGSRRRLDWSEGGGEARPNGQDGHDPPPRGARRVRGAAAPRARREIHVPPPSGSASLAENDFPEQTVL